MKTRYILPLLAMLPFGYCSAKDPVNPVEVGDVQWQRNYPTALASAKKSNKPIFTLFQEVPG